MGSTKMVKIEVELTKPMVDDMKQFIGFPTGHSDQTLKEFVEELARCAWRSYHG